MFSLLGVLILAKNDKLLSKTVFLLVGLSTGTLLGGAFFHLLPESLEVLDIDLALNLTLLSFIVFFIVEKILHWHHCHDGDCDTHTIGHINLVGDTIHNFIDGVIIAGSFLTDIRLGIITTVALVFHEIPQELGDLGVLIHSGIEKKKAIMLNLLVSLSAVLGGVIGFYFLGFSNNLINILLPIAAGGFLYISTSDLIPELRKETDSKRSLSAFLLLLTGLGFMYLLTLFSI